MDDLFGEDAWGEEPDWVKLDGGGEDGGEGGGGGGFEGDGTEGSISGAQHVILLVDCHSCMFQQLEQQQQQQQQQQQRPIDLAIYLAQQLLQKLIRATVTLKIGKRNGVGLILYDTKPISTTGNAGKSNRTSQNNNNNDEDEDDEMEDAEDNSEHEGDEEEEDSSDNDEPTRDVHILLPLDPPGISQVKLVRSCLDGSRDMEQQYANHEDNDNSENENTTSYRSAPLQIALEQAMQMFRKAKCVREKPSKPNEPVDSRSIWILSNREKPYGNGGDDDMDDDYHDDENQASRFIQNVARDAQDSGIQIVLWPLATTARDATSILDMDRFYSGLISYDFFEGHRIATKEAIEDGLEELQQQWKKIRRIYWGPLLLPDWRRQQQQQEQQQGSQDEEPPQIMIDWFRFVQIAKKPPRIQIDQSTKRETIKMKMYMDQMNEIFATFRSGDATDRQKPKGGLKRIRQFATFGGEKVPISTQDLAEMRYLANGSRDKSSLTLLGFKPRDSIPFWHALDPAYFIYPNDSVVTGSTDAFVELYSAMIRKNVVGIGEVLHRTNWTSRLVAIYPLEEVWEQRNEEEVNDDQLVVQKRPPGMMVVTLPYEDDIRALEADEAWRALFSNSNVKQEEVPDEIVSNTVDSHLGIVSEDLLQAAVDLVSRQRLVGVELGEDFENAALTQFFNYLERVALELPVSEEEEAEEFDTCPDENDILRHAGKQIQAFRNLLPDEISSMSKSSTTTRKRKKELPVDESGLDWHDLNASGDLNKVKVPQLKEFLRSVGASLTGTKAVLVERVRKQIESSGLVKSESD